MCGRFALTLPHDAMAQLFDAALGAQLMPTPQYNICPSQNIPVAVAGAAGRQLVSMRWGFVPSWYDSPNGGPMLVNARAETLAEKPAFREACRARRCLIAASGYYEWTKGADGARLPWYIYRRDAAPLVFAGIWQGFKDTKGQLLNSVAMVTTAASAGISDIHHRMPVLIAPDDYGLWLGEAGHGAAQLMVPTEATALAFHRVDPAVNSNRATGPELITAR